MHVKPVRYQNQRCLHFITFSCYRCMPLLDSVAAKETFEAELERVRSWYGCYVTGYVVMPEHVHLLISEPERSQLSVAIQMLKQITYKSCVRNISRAFGRSAITIFPYGAKPNALRSCATSIATRSSEDWWRGQSTGNGVVLFTTRRGQKGLSRSNRNGPRAGENRWVSWS